MSNLRRGWVIIDGDKYNPTYLYHVGKNLWGPRRDEAKVFDTKREADKIADRFDSNAFEVVFDSQALAQPFKVLEWAKEASW